MIPARTSLRSHAPAFMSPTCGISHSVSMLRMCRRTPRTSLRSHSTCIPRSLRFFLEGHRRPSSRDRVINAPCVSSAPRFLAARAGLHFVRFYWVLLRVVFSSFFDLLNNFFVIYIITNTSLTPSHHQNFLSTRHEIVKTRQYTKNGQKWLFLRVSKKRFKMGVFGLFFDLIEKSRFFDINTSSTHQKMRL
jgi:hypothetical protein